MLQDKRITLIVSGGIAAYKSCETARALMRAGAHVRVVMTEHATKFVTPLTFEALTGSPVLTTEWQPGPKGPMPHIDVNRESDLLLVMPATANLIAKAARGIADDLASTLICARRTPIAFVPAMNAAMWRNPATRRNIEFLRREGALIFGPAEGLQACGDTGAGRMLEPAEVVDMMEMVFSPKHLAGKRVLITAGPTYEAIDPVRGITNRSSGLQGFSIARAARDFGAEVTLIAGPTHLTEPIGVKRIDVVSAREMDEAVQIELDRQRFDLFVSVAAVADWRPGAVSEKKIKKEKPLPEITDDEKPFEIPESWCWCRLSHLYSILNGDRGKNYPSKDKLKKHGIPFISAINLDGTKVVEDDKLLCVDETQYNLLNNGKLIKDDIVVCIRGSLGKHARCQLDRGAIASSLVIMRSYCHSNVFASYLMLYLDSPLFFTEIKKYDNGTVQPNLAAKCLEEFFIPLPPLAEQKRIVEKIEELIPMINSMSK